MSFVCTKYHLYQLVTILVGVYLLTLGLLSVAAFVYGRLLIRSASRTHDELIEQLKREAEEALCQNEVMAMPGVAVAAVCPEMTIQPPEAAKTCNKQQQTAVQVPPSPCSANNNKTQSEVIGQEVEPSPNLELPELGTCNDLVVRQIVSLLITFLFGLGSFFYRCFSW